MKLWTYLGQESVIANGLIRSVAVIIVLTHCFASFGADDELTNYKSGIDVIFDGVKGKDYMEEYFYHDKLVTDRKVVYIRSGTSILMRHNERNCIANGGPNKYYQLVGAAGADGIVGTNDDGVIRYRVDRDMSTNVKWSASFQLTTPYNPAYTKPISFDQLEYAPGIPVVGTVGSNGAPLTDKLKHYWRGLIDPFGDEWHTISVADDDEAYVGGVLGLKEEYWSSDGKVIHFVVNPKTPALTVRATGTGQFYTTPPKAYFVPKIHPQTTYFQTGAAGSVTFEICDINGNNVFYRIGDQPFKDAGSNRVVLDQSSFASGENTLEYYYAGRAENTKKRIVVKNPDFPSAKEQHGNLLWRDAAEREKIKKRLTRAPYGQAWSKISTDADSLGQSYWNDQGMRGRRWPWYPAHPRFQSAALNNAFVALILGMDAVRVGAKKSYAAYAKEMLLDHPLTVDNVGWELSHSGTSGPSTEVRGAGYYTVGAILKTVPAYDILIANYRSDQQAGGITPIEDYLIRDHFGRFAMQEMQYNGGWTALEPGMWGTATSVGGLIVALAMPSYSTPYYGTSGFDGSTKTYPWCPFPDDRFTWKQIFGDVTAPTTGYPNLKYFFGPDRDDPTHALIVSSGEYRGLWSGRIGYWSLMSETYYVLMNLNALHVRHDLSTIEMTFLHCVNGRMRAMGDTSVPTYFPSLPMLNERFPAIRADGLPALTASGNIPAKILDDGIWALLWFDDEPIKKAPGAPTNLRIR